MLEALEAIKTVQGLLYLTNDMKQALTDGVSTLKGTLQLEAFEFFKTNDFEPTEQIIPVMRGIVSAALESNLI